ncbi:MAG TPA: hypothetical protein PKA64_04575 [Myxococcota bacterium]|nr:hypothetical protein [Myxococcota bacterium]
MYLRPHALVVVGATLAGTPARAQELLVHPEWLLEPAPGTVYQSGIGSPAVAYDRGTRTWTMYFETQIGPEDGECRVGRWGIGRATSPDGLHWTIDDELVLQPEPGTFYDCVVAHPDVLFDGSRWRLWFKAHQRSSVCLGGGEPPPWGCAAVTGVGQASSADGVHFTVDPEPAINLFSFGFPAVVQVDGVLRMLLAYSNASNGIYELWESVSIDDGASWSAPQFVLGPGFASWVEDEIYNPAMTCDPTPPPGQGTISLFAGGRDTELVVGAPPRYASAGLGRAWSDDGVRWTWQGTEPLVGWNLTPEPGVPPDRDWRHWDAMRVGDEYLLFFSQRDDLGRNRVGLAYTYAAVQAGFPERLISDRICSSAGADTGAPTQGDDTDAPTDSDARDTAVGGGRPVPDAETPKPDPDGCDCDHGSGARLGGAWLIALLLGRRRR